MTTKQRLKTTYFVYIFSMFFMPLMLVTLYFASRERKQQPKQWIKSHYATLKRYTLLNFAWIIVTIFIIWLASLIGYKTFVFFFSIGVIGLIWLWIFNFDQYFTMIIALFVERELSPPKYFQEMKMLLGLYFRTIKDKFDRRKVRSM